MRSDDDVVAPLQEVMELRFFVAVSDTAAQKERTSDSPRVIAGHVELSGALLVRPALNGEIHHLGNPLIVDDHRAMEGLKHADRPAGHGPSSSPAPRVGRPKFARDGSLRILQLSYNNPE